MLGFYEEKSASSDHQSMGDTISSKCANPPLWIIHVIHEYQPLGYIHVSSIIRFCILDLHNIPHIVSELVASFCLHLIRVVVSFYAFLIIKNCIYKLHFK